MARDTDLRTRIRIAADEAERWDQASNGFRELSSQELTSAREALNSLADQLEQLATAAEVTIPVDARLVSTAHIALRRARHGAVWAGYLLHERKSPTDLTDLS